MTRLAVLLLIGRCTIPQQTISYGSERLKEAGKTVGYAFSTIPNLLVIFKVLMIGTKVLFYTQNDL